MNITPKTNILDITPKTNILEALRSQNLSWKDALGELIDNAIDAQAVNVNIDLTTKRVAIADDGLGCSDLQAMLTLGEHKPHAPGRGLGMYGIGLKDACLFFWGRTVIESVRGQRLYTATVDWPALSRASEWRILNEPPIPAGGRTSGTTISFTHFDRILPHGKQYEQLIRDLGFIFTPAIKQGVRIVVRRTAQPPALLQRYEPPPREDVHDGTVEVEGRRLLINVGIVPPEHQNPKPGLQYVFRHRVIVPMSGLGLGEHGMGRIFGWVVLGDGWRLTKNKNDLAELKDKVGDAVEAFCRPVLEKADKQLRNLQLSGLETRLTDLMRHVLTGPKSEKERRDKGDSSGTVTPRHTGRERGASKRQPGKHLPSGFNPSGLKIEINHLDPAEGIGIFSPESNRVILSEGHPAINFYTQKADEHIAELGLATIITGLLANHCIVYKDGRQASMFADVNDPKKFSVMAYRWLGEVMARISGGS